MFRLTPRQLGYVGVFRREAAVLGLPLTAVRLAVACSGAEASLTNWENGGNSTKVKLSNGQQITEAERALARRSLGLGDGVPPWGDNLDSMGLFAQRPGQGWGEPEQLMDPAYAVGQFYDRLVQVLGWETRDPAQVLTVVQGYPNPKVYQEWWPTALSVVT